MLRQKLYTALYPCINRKAARKYSFLKLLRKTFGLIFIPEKISIFGSTMYLHKAGHSFEIVFEGGYEMLETKFLTSLDLNGKTVFDIGACIGYYTLLLSKQVGEQGKIYSFEPESKNFALLNKNILTNKFQNISSCQLAVGGKNQKTYLKISDSPGQHSVQEISGGTEEIQMVTLDRFIDMKHINPQNIGYIKIDAEGCEYEILKGAVDLICKSDKAIIQFEYAPQHLEEQGSNLEELFQFIQKYKLNMYYWDFSIEKLIECTDTQWFLNKKIVQDFKDGQGYSRNILLSRQAIQSPYVVQTLSVLDNKEMQINGETIVKPSPYLDFTIPVNSEIEFPRSGKYFVEFLKSVSFKGRSVLDIGTGYFGFLARHAKVFGASNVVAVDLNKEALENAQQISEEGIEYVVSDVFSSVTDRKFDIIISNPPQLPDCFGGKIHDVAGKDGLRVIEKIINDFRVYTNENGQIYLLLFDFLLGKTKSICKQNKLDAQVVAYYNKTLRKGGETEKRKEVIERLYPGYSFKEGPDGFYHQIYILEIKNYGHYN